MSTLRISNIEAKADSSSPTVDEQLKFTNSDGDLMLYLDGRTAGITTVGINTTNQTIKFDANNNVMVTGIITATEFHGSLAVGTSVTYGDNEKAYFGTGLDLELFHNGTNSVINNTEGALLFQNNGSSSMYIASDGQVSLNNDITFVGASANALWDKSENYFSIPDKIVHSGDTNTAIRFPADDTFSVETGGVQRLQLNATEAFFNSTGANTDFRVRSPAQGHLFFVDAGNDQVTIKTSSAQSGAVLTVNGRTHLEQLTLGNNSTLDGGAQATIYKPATNTLAFATAGANERLRIDSSGRLLVGQTSVINGIFGSPPPRFSVSTSTASPAIFATYSNNTYGSRIDILKSRNAAVGSHTVVQAGDALGEIYFGGSDGDQFHGGALIQAVVESGVGNDDMPTNLRFYTNGGATTVTERLRITSGGFIGINKDDPQTGLTIAKYGTQPVVNGNTYPYPAGNWSTVWNTGTANSTDYWCGFVGSYNVSSATVNISLSPNTFNFSTQQGIYIAGEATSTSSSDFTVGKIIGGSAGGASASAGNQRATKSELFRIDSSGNVGISRNNPSYRLHIHTAATNSTQVTGLCIANDASSSGVGAKINLGAGNGFDSTSAGISGWYDGTGTSLSLFTTASYASTGHVERLRIDSSGDILLYRFSALFGHAGLRYYNTLSGGPQVQISRANGNPLLLNRNSSDGEIVDLRRGWGAGGSIHVGTNSATYNTSSDYRLKENIVAISDGIARLKTLKPSRFNWIGDTSSTRDGFIAHEVTAVPEAITGTKDEVYSEDEPGRNIKAGDPKYQGIDQSRLVPLLVAALQESIARIEALEAKVSALGG